MSEKRAGRKRSLDSAILIALNVVMLTGAVLLYTLYSNAYKERLRLENLENIAGLNQSAAVSATAMVESWDVKLDDVIKFIGLHSMDVEQALCVLEESNSGDARYFELIGEDFTGYLARRGGDGKFIPLDYSATSYDALQRAISAESGEGVSFAPEYTDGATALKHFAVYKHLDLMTPDGPKGYTLLLSTRSSEVLAGFNYQKNFKGQSAVLMEQNGNYIVSNADFKSTNLFQYLYVYNDLSLDERNEIQSRVAASERGQLYYKNSTGEDCVFRYDRMETNNWYCITCVPLASFRTPVSSASYAIYASVVLAALMVIDVFWFWNMNRRLRLSMLREKEAGDAKTDFLSRMSHDIRTPLNGIIGLTSLAIEEPDSPLIPEYLDKINVSGHFLLGLVNDILDMSKVESGKVELHPEPYTGRDLARYLEAVIAPLCAEKDIEFIITPPDDSSPVLLDRLRFNQIIFNLLSNAVKYTPAGGRVELLWARAEAEDGRISLDFTVRDNGIGMSEKFQAHMFDAFTQENARDVGTGTGLGLAIVQSLVRLMNGTISVVSAPGEGTTISLSLTAEKCAAEARSEDDFDGVDLRGKRVLLCEDNHINVFFASQLLEKWGITVDTAENGREGVEKFAGSRADFYNAVLMDIMMPEMNGIEAAKAIRAMRRPDAAAVPIIAMTANAYDTDVENCLAAGMNAHVCKPIEQDSFRAVLSKLMR